MDITLVMDNDEMSSLYQIIKSAKHSRGNETYDLANGWMEDMSIAYNSHHRYYVVFRGHDTDILYRMCLYFRNNITYSRHGEYKMAKMICDLYEKDNNERLYKERRNKQREERKRAERQQAEQAERQRLERQRAEQAEQELQELRRRADEGNAWDTGVADGYDGVWDASDDNWNTDDIPY